MSKILLINTKDVKDYTSMSGNVDENKILPVIYKTQLIYIEPILGSKLYNKLLDLIKDSELDVPANEKYKLLLEEKVLPVHVNYTVGELVIDLAYKIDNGGIEQHQSDTGITSYRKEIAFLKQQYFSDAEVFRGRLNDFLCAHSSDYPEYSQNTNDDISPNKRTVYSGGLYLGNTNDRRTKQW